MTIDLIFITHNRLEYTKLALPSVLADPTEEFSLTIWDNASTDGTVEYLKHEVNDLRIADIILSKENIRQTAAVNEVWGRSKADLVGKLDNDCLVTPGWTRTLAEAHKDIPNLGVVSCWHYFPEDFDYKRAEHKIQQFGKHRILRHPWTCGTGLLIKRDTFTRFGPMQGPGTVTYWLRLAMGGYVNGFYYPLIYQEHMDDPKSKHTRLKDEAAFQAAKKSAVSIEHLEIKTMSDRLRWRQQILNDLLDAPWKAKYYVGWRGRLRRVRQKVKKIVGST